MKPSTEAGPISLCVNVFALQPLGCVYEDCMSLNGAAIPIRFLLLIVVIDLNLLYPLCAIVSCRQIRSVASFHLL
jgi:hypothetical protein